jgi:hypothetical protein
MPASLLIGDYTSLRWIHQVVHDDIRKAYEQQREIIPLLPHYEEMGIRCGVILWPVLLLQQRMLRLSLAYLDHSAKSQAIAHALGAIIEEALQEGFGTDAKDAAPLPR